MTHHPSTKPPTHHQKSMEPWLKKNRLATPLIVTKNNLDIQKCIAQCYDGAYVMSGVFSGVQKRVSDIVPHAVYIHCHAHRLNLCLIQTIQNNSVVVNFFDTVQSLYKYLMNEHTRYELFMKIQADKKLQEIHLERLVETRWSYWHTSLKKILLRYTEIKDVLEVLTVQDDQTARAIGLFEEFSSFKFVLILHIMEQVLSTVHCLSSEFQNSKILLPTAINLVNSLKDELIKYRSEEQIQIIYESRSARR